MISTKIFRNIFYGFANFKIGGGGAGSDIEHFFFVVGNEGGEKRFGTVDP